MILVCPTAHADEVARAFGPSHVLGMRSPDGGSADDAVPARPGMPAGNSLPPHPELPREAGPRRSDLPTLGLVFHDVAEPRPGLVPPRPADVDAILRFGRAWPGLRPLLVHCRMGISRSTAAAFAIACDRDGPGHETRIAAALRAAAPCATPNPRLVALADERLGRGGRMVRAVAAIGRGADYRPYRVFALPVGGRPFTPPWS